jgi:mannose-6-phosphate isomerase-like protein (cupin superfamily)
MELRRVGDAVRFEDARMSKVNLFETPRFFCDLYCLRPGQSQKVHSHDTNDKIYYILRGEANVIVGSEARRLGVDEMVLARAGEPHGLENDSSSETVCLVFMAPHPKPDGLGQPSSSVAE